RGILPANEFLGTMQSLNARQRWLSLPTLCWLDHSDRFLHRLCAAGVFFSVLLMLGIAPAWCLAALWMIYLSLNVVCRTFLSFQWDALLLDAGLASIFFAPRKISPRAAWERPPSLFSVWLLRWLLFRLM